MKIFIFMFLTLGVLGSATAENQDDSTIYNPPQTIRCADASFYIERTNRHDIYEVTAILENRDIQEIVFTAFLADNPTPENGLQTYVSLEQNVVLDLIEDLQGYTDVSLHVYNNLSTYQKCDTLVFPNPGGITELLSE